MSDHAESSAWNPNLKGTNRQHQSKGLIHSGRRTEMRGRFRGKLGLAVVAICALAAAGCGSSGGGKASASPIQIDALVPLTGPSAHISTEDDLPGFKAALAEINADGGVMGHQVQMLQTDLGADPADAVAAVRQLLSAHSNLSGVVGMTSDTAVVVGNLLNASKMATITQSGTNLLDHVHWPYIYRDFPPDSSENIAMAAYGLTKGWKRAALIFGNNGASQVIAAGIAAAYKKHGGTIVANESVPQDKSSYQAELNQMLSAHPQVIFTETDPQSAATIFSEMKGMNNLAIPVVATSVASEGPFWTTVQNAVGGYSVISKFMVSITSPSQYTGPSYQTFLHYYNPLYPNVPANVYIAGNYDSMMIMALAMDLAHSTKPAVYAPYIARVVGDHSGQRVTNYAQGLAAIKAHKPFYYDTTQGLMEFNKYHSIGGTFVVQKLAKDQKTFETVATIPDSEVKAYE